MSAGGRKGGSGEEEGGKVVRRESHIHHLNQWHALEGTGREGARH